MNQYKKLIFCTLLICFAIGCSPSSWEAWRYEHNYEFSGYPAPWNMPDKRQFNDLYIDGAFVNIRVMAHNESIYSGDPPYQIIIPLLSNNNELNSVTFSLYCYIINSWEHSRLFRLLMLITQQEKSRVCSFQ